MRSQDGRPRNRPWEKAMLRSSVWSHVGTLGPVPVSGDARSKVNRGQATHHPVRGQCGPWVVRPGAGSR